MVNGVAVSTFTKEVTGVDDVEEDIEWTSPDFTPNFIRLFTQGQTVIGHDVTVGACLSEGWADDSLNVFSVAMSSEDGSETSNASRRYSKTKLLTITNDQGVVDCECEIVSFSAKKVRIKWTKASTTAIKIHFQVIKAKNVQVGSFTAKTATPASHDISHSAFTANAVMLMGTSQTTPDTEENDLKVFYGMSSGPSNDIVISNYETNGQESSDNARGINENATIRGFSTASPANDYVADFTSFASAKFTINWSDFAPSAFDIGFVVFEFDSVKVGVVNSPAVTGNHNTITGIGFTPNGFLGATCQTGSAGTPDLVLGVGAADGESTPNNAYAGYYMDDGAETMSGISLEEDALSIRLSYWNGPTHRGNGKVISYSNGIIEFNWLGAGIASKRFMYMAFDAQVAAGGANTKRSFVPAVIG